MTDEWTISGKIEDISFECLIVCLLFSDFEEARVPGEK